MELSWVEWNRVELYSCNWMESDHVLMRQDLGFGIGLEHPMPYGWIDVWVFCYEWQYVTRWSMGLQWRINGRWTLYRSVMMTFGGLTELQGKSWNATHTSATMHRLQSNSWNQLDANQRWFVARDELQAEIDWGWWWIAAGDGMRQEGDRCQTYLWRNVPGLQMDCGMIRIVTGSEWISGGGWQEMDLRSWIMGNGRQSLPFPIWGYGGYPKLYHSRNHILWFQTMNIQWNEEILIHDVLPAVWFRPVSHWPLSRMLVPALFREAELNHYMLELQCWIQSHMR